MTTMLPEMHCQEFVERVTDYLEGALAGDDLARLQAHLAECEDCAHYLEQLRVTRRLAGQIAPGDITPGMREGLLSAFERWQAERGASGDGRWPRTVEDPPV